MTESKRQQYSLRLRWRGGGKSTSRGLLTILKEYDVPLSKHETNGTPIGEALRGLLLSKEGTAPSVTTELLIDGFRHV